MKRLITFLIGILITGVSFCQQSNTFKYVIKANGGIEVPVSGIKIGTVTVTRTGTQLNFVDATSSIQTQLNSAKTLVFNVKDYGAKGDSITDDRTAIQAAITEAKLTVHGGTAGVNAYSVGGATVFFPRGKYRISDSIVVTKNYISIRGVGPESVIYNSNTSGHAALRFRDCIYFSCKDIKIQGNGGAFGVGGTGGNGIELFNANYGDFEGVYSWFNGGHGIYSLNLSVGHTFNHVSLICNKSDGINFVSRTTDKHTGANGNGISITNSTFASNGDAGIEWVGSGLNVNGNLIETNKGPGVQLGSLAPGSDYSVQSANITGNYFESNDSSQIKIICADSPYRFARGVVIEGNLIVSNSTVGETSLIWQDVVGAYSESFRNSKIGKNLYSKTGIVTTDILLESPAIDVTVEYPSMYFSDAVVTIPNATASIIFRGHTNTPFWGFAPDVAGITSDKLTPYLYVTPSGDVDITANPQIANGLFDGMELTIINNSSTGTLKFDNGNGLSLTGGNSFTMEYCDIIVFKWNASLGLWIEMSKEIKGGTSNSFITTWQTENGGSATKTIVIPTTGAGYDCWIDWGDGSAEEHATGTPGNITHVYPSTGVKTVKVRGTFPRIYFNNGGDKLKLLTIENWGNTVWSSMNSAFYGCTNLTGNYTDIPNTTSIYDMNNMFNGCAAFNSPVGFSTANVMDMNGMFSGCTAFNQSVSSFNTANVTDMAGMFNACTAFNQSVAGFNTANVTVMHYMFYGCAAFNQSVANFNTAKVTRTDAMFQSCSVFNQSVAGFDVHLNTNMATMFFAANALSTANYDALLIAWGAQAVQNTVTFNAGDAQYTTGGAAAAARAHLVLAVGSGGHGWTIADGGGL
jgi:surface protein